MFGSVSKLDPWCVGFENADGYEQYTAQMTTGLDLDDDDDDIDDFT